VLGAGFTFINAQPMRSELSVAMPKTQAKEPIQFDTLLVCRKTSTDVRPQSIPLEAFNCAVRRAEAKALRLRRGGFALTAGDCRIILYGQFLAEVSPGLDAPALADVLAAYSELLQSTAGNLGYKEPDAEPEFAKPNDEANLAHQLVLLEEPPS
jgi:putative DNA methylase